MNIAKTALSGALAALCWAVVIGAGASAQATNLPVPERGIIGVGSTDRLALNYGDHRGRWHRSLGIEYTIGPRGTAISAGLATELFSQQHYRLVPRIQVAPIAVFRDEFAAGLRTRIGLDNRWIGEQFALSAGLELDSALSLSAPFDRRWTPGLAVGVGQPFSVVDLWITGRGGYSFASASRGTVNYELGLGVIYDF